MSGSYGNSFKIAIFGESHGEAVGITMSGLPSGIKLDMDEVRREMKRRAPGKSPLASERKEPDAPRIISGMYHGKTTGAPLCMIVENCDARPEDYEAKPDLMRPGHGDYPVAVHYGCFNDPRGGGHFSGRLTAPLVFAGAVCKQILAGYHIYIGSHIQSIGFIEDFTFSQLKNPVDQNLLHTLSQSELPLLDTSLKDEISGAILAAKEEGDSVGGVVECIAIGVPAGVGEPFFDSVESTLSHLLFSVPGVKGVEFGLGFASAWCNGSEMNDAYCYEDGQVKTVTNHCGGVTGGITTGMPIVFRAAVRPTASIAKPQQSISMQKRENTVVTVGGRHDPCIVPRAVPVIEAVTAIGILDLIKEREACRTLEAVMR